MEICPLYSYDEVAMEEIAGIYPVKKGKGLQSTR
jgi:hypothetical protein